MSHDIVADTLNQIMNVLRAGKNSIILTRYSKFLISVLAIAKLKGYISEYLVQDKKLSIQFGKLNGCNAIKPRFIVNSKDYDKYVKRYLPARDLGIIIVSTNGGLMTHHTAEEKNRGGSLIAYFY